MYGPELLHHLSERLKGNRIDAANLTKTQFYATNLSSAEFDKSNLTNAFVSHCILHNVTINDCAFTECKVNRVNAAITPTRNFFRECNFSKFNLSDCDLSNSSFTDCKWDGVLIDDIPIATLLKAHKARKKLILSFVSFYVLTLLAVALYFMIK